MVTVVDTRRASTSSLFPVALQSIILCRSLGYGTITHGAQSSQDVRSIDLFEECFHNVNGKLAKRVPAEQVLMASAVAKSMASSGKLTRLTLGRAQLILLNPRASRKTWKSVDSERIMWGLTKSLSGRRWTPSVTQRHRLADLLNALLMGQTFDQLSTVNLTWVEPHARLAGDLVDQMRHSVAVWKRLHGESAAERPEGRRQLISASFPGVLSSFHPRDVRVILDDAQAQLQGIRGVVPGMWAPLSPAVLTVLVHSLLIARVEELSHLIDEVAEDQRAARDMPFWR